MNFSATTESVVKVQWYVFDIKNTGSVGKLQAYCPQCCTLVIFLLTPSSVPCENVFSKAGELVT